MIEPGSVVLAPVQPQPRNLEASKKLAVAQLVIGVLAIILGIITYPLLHSSWLLSSVRPGIWSGGWILITGSIGIRSTRNNNSLNCVYLVFNILSTCVTGVAIMFVCVILAENGCRHYRDRYRFDNCFDATLGLHVPLLIILVIELFVSIFASVYCCQNSSCCQGCCIQQQPGQNTMVAYPQQQQIMQQPGYPQQQQMMQQPGYHQHQQMMQQPRYPQQQQMIQQPGYPQQQQMIQQPGHQQQYAPMHVIQYGAQAPPYSTQPPHNEGAPHPSAPGFVPTVGYDQPPAYSERPSGY